MELGWRGHNIGDGAGSEDRRKEVPPPSTILQASRGAERRRKYLAGGIVGKKRDPRIQDPVIFSGKIRKNRKNSEK